MSEQLSALIHVVQNKKRRETMSLEEIVADKRELKKNARQKRKRHNNPGGAEKSALIVQNLSRMK